MERLVCALFNDRGEADRAIDALVHTGHEEDLVTVNVHEGEIHHEDIPIPGTKSRTRALEGAGIGAAIGGVVGGLIVGPFGFLGVGPLVAAGICAALAAMYGGLAGAITGRDANKNVFHQLREAVQAGKVLLTVDVATEAAAQDAEDVLIRHGGHRVQLA